MKQSRLIYQPTEFIPEYIEEGVLYVSTKYGTAIHKCCCGCGEEVVTPLAPTDWRLKLRGHAATLHPSIGNWSFACRSHYWIRDGKVIWGSDMSEKRIQQGRALDRVQKQIYFKRVNHDQQRQAEVGHLQVLWTVIQRWWRG